eukprot:scaffold12461_cov142-Isochrysis_galbana.AAC.1
MIALQHALPSEESIDDLFSDLNMTSMPARSVSAVPMRSWQGHDGSPMSGRPAARKALAADPKMRRRSIDKQHSLSPMLLRPTKLRDPSACRVLPGSRQSSLRDMVVSSGLMFSCSVHPHEQRQLEEQHQQLLKLAQQQRLIAAELSALRAEQDSQLKNGSDDQSAGSELFDS